MELVLRARHGVAPLSLVEPVRGVLAARDPGIPFSDVSTAAELVGTALSPSRFTAGEVTGLFVRQGAALVVCVVLVGAVGGLALGRALSRELHQVSPYDPLLHGSAALALLRTALVAVWIPAPRAARTDPMRVLREE